MTPNSLSPAFVVVHYHGLYGAHKMTLPTKQYNLGSPGTFDDWSGGTIDASVMVNDFIDLIVPFFPAQVEFDHFEIYTKANATADNVFAYAEELTQIGTSAAPGWSKATEAVFSLKSTGNGIYKVTLLDFASLNSFEKVTFSDLTGDGLAFVNYLTGITHGWSARDDNKPNTFLQISYGLNKTLRRKYNMN